MGTTLDKKLEEQLRYSQANPEDHGARIQLALSYLRSDRPKEARTLLEPVSNLLDQQATWNPFAQKFRTLKDPLTTPAALLDMMALISTAVNEEAVPFYEAASKGEGSDFALTALESILTKSENLSSLDLTRLIVSTMRRRDSKAGELLNDFLISYSKNNSNMFPSYTRFAWATLVSSFKLNFSAFEKEALNGIKNLMNLPRKYTYDYPSPYFPDPRFPAMERQPTRQFGARGGDYEFGPVLALKMRLDHRFLLLDHQAMTQMKTELSELADQFDIPPFEHTVFAEGYGFSWPEAMRPPEENAVAFAEVLNAWHLFPGTIEYVGRRPFDILRDDDILVRRFRRDLLTHSGRSLKTTEGPRFSSPVMDLLKRIGPGRVTNIPDCEDLLEEARQVYCKPGAEALERFYQGLYQQSQIVIPFSED
jgi:hypothetical protein